MYVRILLALLFLVQLHSTSSAWMIIEWEKAREDDKPAPSPLSTNISKSYSSNQVSNKELKRDGQFVAYDDGTVLDTKTSLVWSSKDNGKDINGQDAKEYCENYKGGGYSDWRMPTQDELEGLYDKNKTTGRGWNDKPIHGATNLIDITNIFVWTSEKRGSKSAFFDFYRGGGRRWRDQSRSVGGRALPVRSVKKINQTTSTKLPNKIYTDPTTGMRWSSKNGHFS